MLTTHFSTYFFDLLKFTGIPPNRVAPYKFGGVPYEI